MFQMNLTLNEKLRKSNLPLTTPEQFIDDAPADLPGAEGSNTKALLELTNIVP